MTDDKVRELQAALHAFRSAPPEPNEYGERALLNETADAVLALLYQEGQEGRSGQMSGVSGDFWEFCPDCAVRAGGEHDDGCDVARCLVTGGQRLMCDEDHDCGRQLWSGRWPSSNPRETP